MRPDNHVTCHHTFAATSKHTRGPDLVVELEVFVFVPGIVSSWKGGICCLLILYKPISACKLQ